MAGSGGQLYLWDGKAIWAADADREENWQQAGGIEDGVSFELVSGNIGLDGPEELYLSRLTLRLEAEVKSRIEVAVSYDGGAWETLAQLTADGRRCFDVPFVPRRCGSLRFRLKGRGQLTLRSLTRTSAAAKGGILAQEGELNMASVTGLSKIGLPHLSENMDAEDARAIRNYLYQMQEQLQYVLCNLDVENMSEPLRARLNSIQ